MMRSLIVLRIFTLLGAVFLCSCTTGYQRAYFPPPSDYVALDQLQIKSKFEQVSLNKENLPSEVAKCVPTFPLSGLVMEKMIREFPGKGTTAIAHVSSSKRFIYRGQVGLCLEFSENVYPIYAAETFLATANPSGVPPDVTDEWYKKIATEIAIKGQAKVLYVFTEKGNAYLVSYWCEQSGGTTLYYSAEFKKAGEWENIKVDNRFAYPTMKGFTKTDRGGGEKKSFPLAAG